MKVLPFALARTVLPLTTALAGCAWLAAGVYTGHLQIDKAVALYGGFQGDELSRDQRNPAAQPAILDGATNGIVVRISGSGAARFYRLKVRRE